MEARLRQGLAELDPQLAALPGPYRQVPVPFCSDGRPLAGPVDGAPPGLWAFSGFSGAFTAVPPLAETLAESVAASLAGAADRINHGGTTPL
jgi:glycine/D-amino acid oxidase-like deaminating enzyme